MDLDFLTQRIEALKHKVITDPQLLFNDFLIEDFNDQLNEDGYLYLIDDYDWYLYWINCGKDINDLLESSLNNPPEGYPDILNELTQIKRVVDKKLLKLAKGDTRRIYIDLELIKDVQPKDIKHLHLRFNNLSSNLDDLISCFYSYLSKAAYISDPFDQKFKNNFKDTEDFRPITWEKPMNHVAALLKYLIVEGILFGEIEVIYYLIKSHFNIRLLSDLNEKSIKRTINNIDFRKYKLKSQFDFAVELGNQLKQIRDNSK